MRGGILLVTNPRAATHSIQRCRTARAQPRDYPGASHRYTIQLTLPAAPNPKTTLRPTLIRPLATITEDTVQTDHSKGPARHHHIFGGHCNPWYWYVSTGQHGLPSCYENLCKAIAEFGLPPEAAHDNLNLFQKTLRLDNGTSMTVRSDARVGDYVDFYAELDLLFAASLCPRGSGASEPSEPVQERNPVTVQIFNSGMEPEPFSYESMRATFTAAAKP